MSDLETFLAGAAPDYVTIVLGESSLSEPEALDAYAEPVGDGRALVLGGATGRSVFQQATGQDPMAFARAASDRDGHVERDLSGGDCPDAAGDEDHEPRIVFAFAEAQNEAAGGLYAEGPVIHAYVECGCGTRYADKWVVDGE
ncbi:MAG: DUF5807 family protein [Halobacteriales archaeon]|nr:DUF5807 family protein [Halobacteriales archaeon]